MLMKRRLKTFYFLLVLRICCAQAQQQLTLLVGTYTYGGSKGIYSYHFNQETGEATLLDSLSLRNPSFLTISHDGSLVIQVFRRDVKTGMLTDTHRDIRVSKAVCVQFK